METGKGAGVLTTLMAGKGKKRGWRSSVFLLLAALLLTAGAAEASAPLRVLVGVAPVGYLAEQVGGDLVTVQVLVPPGRDPHHFEPSPGEIMAASRAAVYFTVGLDFEAILARRLRASASGLRIVPLVATAGAAADPHQWMAPLAAKEMCATIAATLAGLLPRHAAALHGRAKTLGDTLAALHTSIAERLRPYRGRAFFTVHGGFGPFARAYGLRQEVIEPHGGGGAGPRRLAGLIRRGRQENVRLLLVQPAFATGTAQLLAKALGARLETVDPLAPDLVATYQTLAAVLERAFQP